MINEYAIWDRIARAAKMATTHGALAIMSLGLIVNLSIESSPICIFYIYILTI
jgi:hypothetical protein